MEQVAAELHMALVFSIAGKPRGRGKVERIFETTNQLFLCHQPGYTPPGSAPARPVLSLPELDVRLRRFLVETYQQRVHSETGVAPALRWEASGFLPRLPDSAEELDLLLLTVAEPRRVHATARSGRPSPHRPGAHRHARPAEATGTLRAAVLTRWLRASVPAPERTGV